MFDRDSFFPHFLKNEYDFLLFLSKVLASYLIYIPICTTDIMIMSMNPRLLCIISDLKPNYHSGERN